MVNPSPRGKLSVTRCESFCLFVADFEVNPNSVLALSLSEWYEKQAADIFMVLPYLSRQSQFASACVYLHLGGKQSDGAGLGAPFMALTDGVESARGKSKPVYFMVTSLKVYYLIEIVVESHNHPIQARFDC